MRKSARILRKFAAVATLTLAFLMVCLAGAAAGSPDGRKASCDIATSYTWRDGAVAFAYVIVFYFLVTEFWKAARRLHSVVWRALCALSSPGDPVIRFGKSLGASRLVRWWKKLIGY
jgi:hypothetical protein